MLKHRGPTSAKTYRWSVLTPGGSKVHGNARVFGLINAINDVDEVIPGGVKLSYDKAYRSIRDLGVYAVPFKVEHTSGALAAGPYVALIALSDDYLHEYL